MIFFVHIAVINSVRCMEMLISNNPAEITSLHGTTIENQCRSFDDTPNPAVIVEYLFTRKVVVTTLFVPAVNMTCAFGVDPMNTCRERWYELAANAIKIILTIDIFGGIG